MLRWAHYAFLRITFFFTLGILSAVYFGNYLSITNTLWLFSSSAIAFLTSKFLLRKQFFFSLSWVQGVFSFFAIFLLGYLNLTLHNESLREDHLLKATEFTHYKGTINSSAEQKTNTLKYDFEVTGVLVENEWQTVSGSIYLYVDKKQQEFSYGDQLLINGRPDEISPPMNPGEFDYKRFLSFNNVYHQDYLQDKYLVIGHEEPYKILSIAYDLRQKASKILKQHISSDRENNIAQALVLGVKDGLDRDIEHAYSASGAMHVLAVSGLHVGIVYGIILLFFKPFRKTKVRNWTLAIVSLIVLWSYAMITGFSPSVLRAVTMFSFIAIAQASGRNTNIYNTLAASGFILLVYNPFLIMSVGFQLSFLAVFGIVYIQPRLYNALEVDNYFLDKVWAITAVSIAAQIATIPLTLLYFHQFPTFFLISNLVVIPGAFIILCLGLFLLAVSSIGGLASIVGWLLEKLIFIVNYAVFKISEIPYSQVNDIEINTLQSWLIIGLIVMFLMLFEYRKFKYLKAAFTLALLFASFEVVQSYTASHQNRITVYRVNNHTAIEFIEGTSSQLFTDSLFKKDSEGLTFHIRPNRLYSGIINHRIVTDDIPFIKETNGLKVVYWKGVSILILSEIQKRLKLTSPVTVDYVLLTHDFNKSVNWLDENFNYKQLIFDGSIKWYLADDLKHDADSLQTNYYSVYHDGALDIDLNKR